MTVSWLRTLIICGRLTPTRRNDLLLLLLEQLDLEDQYAELLLVRRVDLLELAQCERFARCVRDDLLPGLDGKGVCKVRILPHCLDPDGARDLGGLELDQIAGRVPLHAVVGDADLEGLGAGHDGVVVRALDSHCSHVDSFFLVHVVAPLLYHAVRRVAAREDPFEIPSVPLQARHLPCLRHEVDIQLVAVVGEKTLEVNDEGLERRLVGCHERHQLDGVTLFGCGADNAGDLPAALGDVDDLELGINVSAAPALVPCIQSVYPSVVDAKEVALHLGENEGASIIGVLLRIERHNRDVGGGKVRVVDQLLVQHVLVDTSLVVILSRPGDPEPVAQEETERLLVRRGHGAVQLASSSLGGVLQCVIVQHAANPVPAEIRRHDQGADLDGGLLLVNDVNQSGALSSDFCHEHVLSGREVADMIDTPSDVSIENALSMSVVVSPVERT